MTTQERADRQKVMMALRSWMAENDMTRRDVAYTMGITTGHLSTLINANRTPSQEQVDIAQRLMGEAVSSPTRSKKAERPTTKKAPLATTPTPAPRPLTKSEGDLVAGLAKAWLKEHEGASRDEFVEVVRVLSIAVRS